MLTCLAIEISCNDLEYVGDGWDVLDGLLYRKELNFFGRVSLNRFFARPKLNNP